MDQKVKIVMRAHGRGEVFLDDKKIKGVKEFAIFCHPDKPNILSLYIQSPYIEVEGPFKIVDDSTLESETKEFKKIPS